jgi:filamentous hemagglutinin family protein
VSRRRTASADSLPLALSRAAVSLVLVFALATPAQAGDILRGGAALSNTRTRATAGSHAGADVAAQTQANAKDRLARTTQALNAVRALQAQARAAAAGAKRVPRLDPNHPGRMLPNVRNGLGKGGLQVDPLVPKNLKKPTGDEDPSLWIGANLPKQTRNKDGGKDVTIVQTKQQALLTWKTFNVGSKTTLTFDQSRGKDNASEWIAFNKINDPKGRPSQILGKIKADGQVYVMNRNGIIFGGGSQVNVHTLVASSLPLNTNLVETGLLNNPDAQFLFSALPLPAGSKGTPEFQPDVALTPDTPIGDVVVEEGALLESPTSAAHVGGRIMLVGPNVENAGTISTPEGQTILAAGLQVGIDAHSSDDASLRGLDVYVGAVTDPNSDQPAKTAGVAKNTGLIDAPHADVMMTGKDVRQLGVIDSSTTVDLNGRIDLIASYDAVSNTGYDASNSSKGPPFAYRSTGTVTFGKDSVSRILPDFSSTKKIAASELAFASRVNVQGQTIHLDDNAIVLAPNAEVTMNAGAWNFQPATSLDTPVKSDFIYTGGQIYFDPGALVDVAGTTDAFIPQTDNILSVQLRGSEVANSPLQRDSIFRPADGNNPEITVDLRNSGTFNGSDWIGTPLADLTGYADIIERDIAQLTTKGGSVNLHAGGSVVLQNGSTVDVSGGWVTNEGGFVQTTRVISGGELIDISKATPDRVYDGIYTAQFTAASHPKWGLTQTYANPLSLFNKHYESSDIAGRDGGSVDITAASMALDGKLVGRTTAGPRQLRNSLGKTDLPGASKLSLTFRTQDTEPHPGLIYPPISPTAPRIVFTNSPDQKPAAAFAFDALGNPLPLRGDRTHKLELPADLIGSEGFGELAIDNSDGNILVPADVTLNAGPKGSISMKAANIDIAGDLIAPGGSLAFTVYDFSPYQADILAGDTSLTNVRTPDADPTRGKFTLRSGGTLSTAGLVADDRFSADATFSDPIVTDGGSVSITSYAANLRAGGVIDVSGGAAVSTQDKITYGDAGAISILAGQDPKVTSILGGRLQLDSTLRGYTGGDTGGSLTIQAPLLRVGGGTPDRHEFALAPDFFNRGGFSSFTLIGLGSQPFQADPFADGSGTVAASDAFKSYSLNRFLPGLVIEDGTTISPLVQTWRADPLGSGSDVTLTPTLLEQSLRPAISLAFTAKGVTDYYSKEIVARGDLVMGEGSDLRAGPLGSVSLSGETVAVLGSVRAPGGSIAVTGAKSFPLVGQTPVQPRVTVYLGPDSQLFAGGATVLTPDPYGRRTGSVLPGGDITISGNILADTGSVLNVSGTSGILDVAPAEVGRGALPSVTSGVNSPLFATASVPVRVDSDGGTITLKGSEELFVGSTLRGEAGGPTALGGSLYVSSGLFYPPTATIHSPLDVNLVVKQSGPTFAPLNLKPGQTGVGQVVRNSVDGLLQGSGGFSHDRLNTQGDPIQGRGYFTADQFLAGGFDSLSLGGTNADGDTLGGVVSFNGPVNIAARQKLSVAGGGVIYANDHVDLAAPYVQLGTPFVAPLQPDDPLLTGVFFLSGQPAAFRPTTGPGKLTVHADLIDVGNLLLRGIHNTSLLAPGGDIRGDGSFDVAGALRLEAGQIYPATGVSFTIAAYDYKKKNVEKGENPIQPGTITIVGSGSRRLPLSAGGELNIYATKIQQGGALRAPIGTINLGWDGTGDAPKDLITGAAVPVTESLVLGSGSETSVSAIDPTTGESMIIPYGLVLNGTSWIDPAGIDITAGGVPQKSIQLSANKLVTRGGSTIDIRGGGNLYAYRWVTGLGGTQDILASNGSFAVIPGYQANYAPYAEFNQTQTAQQGFNPNFDPSVDTPNAGYKNGTLSVGDRVYLEGSDSLAAGTYTLLPARYALLPGAVLVTPKTATTRGKLALPDGSTLVSGYRFNDLNSSRTVPKVYTQFEVLSSSVMRSRAKYEDYYANSFLAKSARDLGVKTPRLPLDAGHLAFEAGSAMTLRGDVTSAAAKNGIGAYIDISSPLDIWITGDNTKLPKLAKDAPAPLVLDATKLSGYGAESLLIGGIRTNTEDGASVGVRTGNITVDNAGSALMGPEVILAANDSITLAPHASIQQTGTMRADAQRLTLDGDGALLRVSSDPSAQIARTGVTGATDVKMTIGDGARIGGTSLILDSSHATDLSAKAHLTGDYVSLNSGQISLRLANPGDLQPTVGLVLAGQALHDLQGVRSLSLLSYSSIDLYGSGSLSIDGDLALHAAEIRGFHNDGRKVTFKADTITLDNRAHGTRPGATGELGGRLGFDADTIEIGGGRMNIDQFATLGLNASQGLVLSGHGGLRTQGDLVAMAPSITAERSATQSLVAAGSLQVLAPKGGVTDSSSELGASLTLQGASVVVTSDIVLPSGLLTLHATQGDVTVGGALDVGGAAQNIYDVVKYTDGGAISLLADNGSVNAKSGSMISVSAQSGGGNAGSVSIGAAHGDVTLAGTLLGKGGKGGKNGSFSLDVAALPKVAAISEVLDAGSFTESRSYRVRTGDVTLGAESVAHHFSLSADAGSITLAGSIDASGQTGGSIFLSAAGSLTLLDGSKLSVAAKEFSHAGKGGSITLEAGSETNGTFDTGALLDIRSGSEIDLGVAASNDSSESLGRFTGTLHLRAPQLADGSDLQIAPINGTINGASNITVEGYRLFDLTSIGGQITDSGTTTQPEGGMISSLDVNVQESVRLASQTFGNATDAIKARLFTGDNADLAARAVVMPGAEIINRAESATADFSLTESGGSVTIPSGGGTLLFPNGTPGDAQVTSSLASTIVLANGDRIPLAAKTPTSLPAGASLEFTASSLVSYATGSTSTDPIAMKLAPGTTFSASATKSSATVTASGTIVALRSAGKSSLALAAGSSVLFVSGTPGTRKIVTDVPATIVAADGTTTALAANTPTSISAGSTVTLSTAGNLSYALGGSGSGTPSVALLAGSFSTAGSVTVTPPSGNLTLGTTNSTGENDWNLNTYRFGPQNAPGVLTLRARGNLAFYNALQDGFEISLKTTAYTAPLMAANPLLPLNAQSWSFRLAAGADLGAADFHQVLPLSELVSGTGSLLLGKNAGTATASGSGANAVTKTAIDGGNTSTGRFYQVIRTGSGDIDIAAARDVQLLNQFATIYTAGVKLDDPTMGGEFEVPIVNVLAGMVTLGAALESPSYPVQYSLAGGNVSISAGHDIIHLTRNTAGALIDDASRELPINWLFRRGYVDPATGEFGLATSGGDSGSNDNIASTTWWIDFANFFEGVGALGGGDVTLTAANDVKNVDAVAPTNARMPKGKPDASKLVELGGGDVTVTAGHDINAGVYYTERGDISLTAGNSILTNAARSPSLNNLTDTKGNLNPLDEHTWLPTSFFLGKGNIAVSARGDLLLGSVANPFLLPGGYSNSFWYKTYFSTYSPNDTVDISSLGGSITLRESAAISQSNAQSLLYTWFSNVLLLGQTASPSSYQPWLRLDESNVAAFQGVSTLMPATLRATAFSGDVNLVGDLTLSPGSRGTIDLLAGGSINGLQIAGVTTSAGQTLNNWIASHINLSDANPNAIPGIASPFAYQTVAGDKPSARISGEDMLAFVDSIFAESGSLNGVIQTKQTLHAAGLLHGDDPNPVHLYAQGGDISGLTLFSGKSAHILAGNDITDIAFYVQNVSEDDVTVVSAGHDIIPFNENSPLRSAAIAVGNILANGQSTLPGDIQISGPGTLEVLAGHNLDLGTGGGNADGTGAGITSVGNARNPYLPFGGASIIAGAGIGLANGLEDSQLDFQSFISDFVEGDSGARYLGELASRLGEDFAFADKLTPEDFSSLPTDVQSRLALDLFYLVLRDAGRDHNDPTLPGFGNYDAGFAAIDALFGKGHWKGDIDTRARDIRTKNGGDISLFAPGGKLQLANSTLSETLAPPGIVTESGGNISIFTDGDVDLGIGRIFTLRGGNEIIWSSAGDIAAGASAKTVKSAPPTRVLIDPQSADVKTDLAGLATGGGIGVLATVEGVPPGEVDLIAPVGIVDAGDAGIRASGTVSIAATKVLNASNISATTTVGVPSSAPPPAAPPPAAPASNSTAATNNAANEIANQAAKQQQNTQNDTPSLFDVEVLGYGGGEEGSVEPRSSSSEGTSPAAALSHVNMGPDLAPAPEAQTEMKSKPEATPRSKESPSSTPEEN